MTSPTMSDGSAWAPIMTPPALRSMRFADGGVRWEGNAIPKPNETDDQRRRRRQQRLSCAVMENRAAEACRRAQGCNYGLPPAARDEQVEQNRASSLLVHHDELARQAIAQLSHHRPIDRRTDYRHRPQSSG